MMSPVMLAERTPSVRLISTGPSRMASSAISPRGAEPACPAMMSEPTPFSPPEARGSPATTTSYLRAVYRDGRYGLADEVLAELEGDLARGEAEERGLLRVDLYRNLGDGPASRCSPR